MIKSTAEAIFNEQHSVSNADKTAAEMVAMIEARLTELFEEAKKLGEMHVINRISVELDRVNTSAQGVESQR